MAVEKWEVPKTISELRAFLGSTSYYSIYIKDYAKIVGPLHEKLKVPSDVGKKGAKYELFGALMTNWRLRKSKIFCFPTWLSKL